ncbi:MAG: M48 family metallopeptidase [Corynebacterium sp.]|nr:M48 family metallopeptidase [Corynebacterium sp.]
MDSNLEIKVIRSTRRKRSAAARINGNVIEVRIPAGLSTKREAALIEDVVAKVHRRSTSVGVGDEQLTLRAEELNRTYLDSKASWRSIRWASNQLRRWGSCTPSTGEIRISSRLREVPGYVLDSVLLHELAHTIESNHSKAFYDLLANYPKQERAEGFLEAWGRME